MFKIIEDSSPRYLAASDALIGDMSNIIYEFLVFNKPIILLSNDWVKKAVPNIGEKTSKINLEKTIMESLKNPNKFEDERSFWLRKTISRSSESPSARYIDIILEKSKIKTPNFLIVNGGNSIKKTNLDPLITEIRSRMFNCTVFENLKSVLSFKSDDIIIAAHFEDLKNSSNSYNVHIDHDLKGIGTANLKYALWDYKRNNYFPHIDLHIVPGEAGLLRTKLVLGPLSDRTVIGGYPKEEDLLKFSSNEQKLKTLEILGFKNENPLVTYAPASERSFLKPGGSFDKSILALLEKISIDNKINLLIKMKYNNSIINRLKSTLIKPNIFHKRIIDDGSLWNKLKQTIKKNSYENPLKNFE